MSRRETTTRQQIAGGAAKRLAIENVNHPGGARLVDAERYAAMRRAVLAALPPRGPALSYAALLDAVRAMLPQRLFPGGQGAGWWLKTVQLDLEAKARILRVAERPLRLRRA